MPMRAYRTSTSHIASNLPLWIGISIAVTLACAIGVWQMPRSNVWSHLTALAGMFAGTLVMMRSQEGYVPPDYAVEDDYVPPAV